MITGGSGGLATTTALLVAFGNPIVGKSFYANLYYTSKILSLIVLSILAVGSATLATKATKVVKIGTFM
jgi:cellulose 1,4-beta-cellobiosidase